VKSTIGKIWFGAVCLLLTPFAALAALPSKLGIQSLFPDFIVFYGDNQWHAGYTLILTNYTKGELQVSSVSVRGLVDQTEVYSQTYTAADLTVMFSSVKGDYETPQEPKLEPGESGVLYFFLGFTSLNNIPQTVENSFQVTNESGKSDTITIAPLQRQVAAPEVVNAPLQGSGWWTPNGPSNDSVHRRTLIVINGELSITEEFAVDWVKLGQNGATFSGDPLNNASYFAYDQKVVAAAGGRIIKVRSDVADNTPTQYPNPDDLEVETLPGNHIVEDFGDGRYALYAHMIPGSITVQEGDVVAPGQVLGRLGNSGNSGQPHLHFHVMDGPQPLGPRGVPFQIANWLRVPYQIICGSNTNCDPTEGPTNLQPGTPVRVQLQAFMNLDLGRF
jgi:murein DD-endopeptidase MepM/ murein hydrolase activator NlpD